MLLLAVSRVNFCLTLNQFGIAAKVISVALPNFGIQMLCYPLDTALLHRQTTNGYDFPSFSLPSDNAKPTFRSLLYRQLGKSLQSFQGPSVPS